MSTRALEDRADTGVRGYLSVLTHGPAVRPFAAATLARLPVSMSSLGIIVLVEHVRGSYTVAGIVTGVMAVGATVGAPIFGRAMDRFGQPRVIVPTAVLGAFFLAAIALAAVNGASDTALIGLAFLAGLFIPPIGPAMRVGWRVIFEEPRRQRLGYALDASAVELLFVGGPVLLSVLAATTPAQVPLLVAAGAMLVGSLAYSGTQAARSWRRVDRTDSPVSDSAASLARHEARSAVNAPGVLTLLCVSLLMAAGFGQLDTSMVATADRVLGSPDKLGYFFAAVAGGSTVGGLVYGSRHWGGDELRRIGVMMGVTAVALIPVPLLLSRPHPPLPLLLALLFVAGTAIAPTLIMFQNTLDLLAPPHRVNEAQAMLSASMTIGVAFGTAAAGWLIDQLGPVGSFVGALSTFGVGALLAMTQASRWRRHVE